MKIVTAEFVNSVSDLDQLPAAHLPEIVFIGRSNVGKSSLINKICSKSKLAKTSSVPGRTRMLNYYLINESFYFVDLPGYGYAKVPEQIKTGWRKLVEEYISTRDNIKLVFELMDSRHDPTYLDQLMINWLEYYELNYAIVLTKADKISANKMERQIYRTSKIVSNDDLCKDYIPFSAITGEGKDTVNKLIEESLNS
ncbi:MAG: ribosome biogenesis GTP-binding protein YihA/YsxC [Chlorobi bacterium]|nr:ribosome biogenesis GTP-binding protein YihA/YsxC [Chlorobiota bacterium]MCI0714889.1 ribosome biogenesis GTP-binding protein YihA/YsxC [Chlorobiota bacterium]